MKDEIYQASDIFSRDTVRVLARPRRDQDRSQPEGREAHR
jgi:hypothetical protein